MDNIIKTELVTMVNTRGSLKYIQSSLVNDLKAQGWRIVVNPKREYYPELDQENKNNTAGPVAEELDQGNILQFEDV